MTARLIVNADDFGLTAGINRAIGELHAAGALTSATLMANGRAFEDAVAVARAYPSLGVGCHVVLTDGLPLCPPELIPSLMGADGSGFRRSFADFAWAVLCGSVSEDEVVREGVAQVERLQRAGISVSHLDTHKHTHLLPSIARALLRVAAHCGVGAVRNPFEPCWARAIGRGGFARRLSVMLLDLSLRRDFEKKVRAAAPIRMTAGTLGVAATGSLDAAALSKMLEALPKSGAWEMVVHPGYHDQDLGSISTRLHASREVEREALLACVPDYSRRAGLKLIHYGEL